MSLFSAKTKINTSQTSNQGIQFSIYRSLPPQQTPTPSTAVPHEAKKMTWGEPTWFLFHTLAFKLKDECFIDIKNDFLKTCFLICRYLPCPTCAEHATHYTQNINVNAIQTKQQVKDLFYEFHNMVNKRKGFPIFNKSDLDEKYSKAVTLRMIQNFLAHYREKSRNIRNIANDFFREKAITQISQWFSKNLQCFDL